MDTKHLSRVDASLCECGCGQPTRLAPYTRKDRGWIKGQPVRFVQGHHSLGLKRSPETCRRISEVQKGRSNPSGADAPNWRGGRHLTNHGYVRVFVGLLHPMADTGGYCFEHRLVVAAAIGRTLTRGEIVHHVNGVKDDNRLENLELVSSQADHVRLHAEARRRGA